MRPVIQSLKAGWIWLVLGVVAGAFIPANGLRSLVSRLPGLQSNANAANPMDEAGHAEDEHDDHIALTDVARRNLGLRTARVRKGTYTRTVRIPGVVRERPALSDLAISSRVHGVVTHIHATPGQAVKVGQPLFRIRLTGDELATAQSQLLDSIQQIERIDSELERLNPASRSGGVARNKLLKLKYDKEMYELRKKNRTQELFIRGLTEEQVAEISKTKQFIQHVDVAMSDAVKNSAPPSKSQSFGDGLSFTIEELHVHPGKSVQAGDELCDVAYHTNLYFEGQAFERDVDMVRAVSQDGTTVGVEFSAGSKHEHLSGLKVLYIDNHVDPDTQTFRFYMSVENEVMGDVREGETVFRSWRFKPGQRGHVLLPAEEIADGFPLPREAVLVEGPDAFVFRELPDGHDDHDGEHNHAHDEHVTEFEPVPVQILYQDESTVVVQPGALKAGERIAINRAYDLQLALKSGSGGGHAHDHGHEH